ncbi:RlpA-like double-psi beta-barrel domain-containing protein [Paenibacillus humicus]|uniref:RlpA-like double-psi beta-barrel domain-containing protein n=1 Tax=Paenibacillus humicus TaxID=412861 RepID=UPI003F164FDD
MSNSATIYTGTSNYTLRVNGNDIFTSTNLTRVTTIKNRLNYIYSDADRDLDFITASYDGDYIITCPLVRKNVGQKTYFYGGGSYPEKLYENTYWNDSSDSDQTAIYTSQASSAPWNDAFTIANKIRYAVTPNFDTAAGKSIISRFTAPANTSGSVSSTISSSAHLEYYGDPCQGTQSGNNSTCGTKTVQNIASAVVANGEVFHPCDLTAAMTSTNSWHTLYRNKFVKVTNLSNNQSIVVRVTDTAPVNKGIELSYRAYQSIGSPATGANKVKVELLG